MTLSRRPMARCAALLLLGVLACGNESRPRRDAASVTVLTGATLIRGEVPEAGHTLVINAGMIEAIFPDGEGALPDAADVVELQGRFVIPGLIDSHLHAEEETLANLRKLTRDGITSFRDPAHTLGSGAEMNKRLLTASDVPDMRWAPIFAGERLGDFPVIDAESDLAALMSEARAAGAYGIKIYAELSSERVTALAQSGREHGLALWGHVHTQQATSLDMIRAGVSVLSHSAMFEDEGLEGEPLAMRLRAMAERDVYLDSTHRVFLYEDLSDSQRAYAYDVTRVAHQQGVRILAGTDDSVGDLWTPGSLGYAGGRVGLHEEMELLVRHAGLTPYEAIEAATVNGARASGWEDRGSLEVGKVADLVILNANPLENISHTREIHSVYRKGLKIAPLVER